MSHTKPFQIALNCGANLEQVKAAADTVVDLTPGGGDEIGSAMINSLKRCGLTPADVRTQAVLIVDGDTEAALVAYAAVTGFAARHLDVAASTGLIHAPRVCAAGRALPDAGRPAERAEVVQVGGSHPDAVVLSLNPLNPFAHWTPQQVSTLRWARRVRLVAPQGLTNAVMCLAAVAGVRSRSGRERLPLLVRCGVPADTIPVTPTTEGADSTVERQDDRLLDLDAVRSAAAEFRRGVRGYDASVLADPQEPDSRTLRLREAAAVPVLSVLGAYGSTPNSAGDLWQCPRPASHTHGDTTPSMRVQDGRVRCYVDDSEWVDSLRLVMEVSGATADEAADMLLSGPESFEADRLRIVACRAALAAPPAPPQL